MNYNHIIVSGKITSNVQITESGSAGKTVKFNMTNYRTYPVQGSNEQKTEETTITVGFRNGHANDAAKYKIGDEVLVSGHLEMREVNVGGVKRKTLVVNGRSIQPFKGGQMNYFVCTGRTTRKPEIRYFQDGSGNKAANVSLATNNYVSTKGGGNLNEVVYIDMSAFSNNANTVENFVGEKQLILIEGQVREDRWEDKQSREKRSKLVVTILNLQLAPKGMSQPGGNTQRSNEDDRESPFERERKYPSREVSLPTDVGDADEGDEELPF